MKNKFVYLLSFIVATFLFLSSTVFATDIDMNLQPNNNSTGYSSQENSIDDEDDYDNTLNNSVETDNSIDQSTTVKSVSSVAEESFGLSQILNILLIVVGIVLILLAIAILIRLNS